MLSLSCQIQKIPVSSDKQVHLVYPVMTIHHCIMEITTSTKYHFVQLYQEMMSHGMAFPTHYILNPSSTAYSQLCFCPRERVSGNSHAKNGKIKIVLTPPDN